MEKRWISSVFVVLAITLVVFMIGFYSGNITGDAVSLSTLFKKPVASQATIMPTINNPEILKISAIQAKKLTAGQVRSFGTFASKKITRGCNEIYSTSAYQGGTGHSLCAAYNYSYCSGVHIVGDGTIDCGSTVNCNTGFCLAYPGNYTGTYYNVTVQCCNI